MATFQKAVKRRAKLRLALAGTTGAGKTYSALVLAQAIGGRVAVIDSERGSASLYADQFSFDVVDLTQHSVDTYASTIRAAAEARYDVLIIDSLSHEWMGKGGVLEEVDRAAAAQRSKFNAWNGPSQKHTTLIDEILAFPGHVICTLRKKMEYVLETDAKGRQVPRKIGLAPVQREGMEYEFTCVFDLEPSGVVEISKHRTGSLLEERRTTLRREQLGEVGKLLVEWLNTGAPGTPHQVRTSAPSPAPSPASPPKPVPPPQTTAQMTDALKASLAAQAAAKQTNSNGNGGSEADKVLAAVREAQGEKALSDLVPRIMALDTESKALLRKEWGRRRDELRNAQQAGVAP